MFEFTALQMLFILSIAYIFGAITGMLGVGLFAASARGDETHGRK